MAQGSPAQGHQGSSGTKVALWAIDSTMSNLKEVFKNGFLWRVPKGSENVPWQLHLHFSVGPQACELSDVSRRYKADQDPIGRLGWAEGIGAGHILSFLTLRCFWLLSGEGSSSCVPEEIPEVTSRHVITQHDNLWAEPWGNQTDKCSLWALLMLFVNHISKSNKAYDCLPILSWCSNNLPSACIAKYIKHSINCSFPLEAPSSSVLYGK